MRAKIRCTLFSPGLENEDHMGLRYEGKDRSLRSNLFTQWVAHVAEVGIIVTLKKTLGHSDG